MTDGPRVPADARERQLTFFLALSSPTRIAVIDALKAWGALSDHELGEALVSAGDLAPQARVNLGRVHLQELLRAELIEKFVDEDGVVRYREGPGLAGGINWTDISEDDEELVAAAQEFERVMVERRINRMRWWATARWSRWPRKWSESSIGRDNVVHCTADELRELDRDIAAVFSAFEAKVAARRAAEGPAEERPCFRTVSVFPWGGPAKSGHAARG
ncbi:ArsR/SmtB family transcription factor [Luteipulveratus halotolerans]|uniref:HTH arsR-type domain-containing protein n=1 Tax=Luteipulveratus halotolerans TaxID=1631356 RepID=A0A0L6CPV6_9MICO|nr:helix-turn-helix transcriptional regulator [Luteipulveratus halotolerans]KNX39690.1 hypothetical protein VV01_00180 [Luteipulveratus halotolerans]